MCDLDTDQARYKFQFQQLLIKILTSYLMVLSHSFLFCKTKRTIIIFQVGIMKENK